MLKRLLPLALCPSIAVTNPFWIGCGLGAALLSWPLTPSDDTTTAASPPAPWPFVPGTQTSNEPAAATATTNATVDPLLLHQTSAIPSSSSSSSSSLSWWSVSHVTAADALLCGLLPCLILAVMLCLFLLERKWAREQSARKQRQQRSVRESSEQDQGEGDNGGRPTKPDGDDAWMGRRVGDVVLGRLIAKGLYGHVREGRHVATGAKVAVKVVERSRVPPGRRYEEIDLMRRTNHRNIVGLLDVVETKEATFLVLEYLGGGELFHYMQDKRCLSEDEARRYWRQIVCAVAYMHCSGIAHRDLKLENVMFAAPGGRRVKVIDLGLSSSITPGRLLRSYCGSVEYAAPEVLLRQPHDGRSSDVWALGVMVYALVVGFRPFLDCKAVVQGNYVSLDEVARAPDGVDTTPEFRDLLQRIFQTDPRQRISIHGLMAHPWTGF